MKKLVPLSLLSLFLSACGDNTQTVEYYSQHLNEAKTVRTQCEKESATQSENCKNARKALLNDSYEKALHGNGLSY
ncbi:EexN family lipoprotein [Vibrio parahaemolyticus]|nr:EexN family lipoprotein [Vibrio parahaemolyticus]